MKGIRKFVGACFALAMAFVLAVPAFAAEAPHDVDTRTVPATWEDWGDALLSDSALIINGVIGQEEYEGTVIFDVVVGGGYTLNMGYPDGRARFYATYLDNVQENREYLDNGQFANDQDGWFDSDNAQNQYVYTCTEDMVSTPGHELLFHYWLDWDDSNPASEYSEYGGNVNFYLRVNPAPANVAYASTQTVNVDGKAVEFQMYALKDENGNDTNYIKLRDLAFAIGQVQEGFEVEWKDGAVNIDTTKTYTVNGSEMSTPFSGDRPYEVATAPTTVDGKRVELNAFILKDDNGGAYTYYQLRDLGKALGFNVGWSAERGIFVETDKPYGG